MKTKASATLIATAMIVAACSEYREPSEVHRSALSRSEDDGSTTQPPDRRADAVTGTPLTDEQRRRLIVDEPLPAPTIVDAIEDEAAAGEASLRTRSAFDAFAREHRGLMTVFRIESFVRTDDSIVIEGLVQVPEALRGERRTFRLPAATDCLSPFRIGPGDEVLGFTFEHGFTRSDRVVPLLNAIAGGSMPALSRIERWHGTSGGADATMLDSPWGLEPIDDLIAAAADAQE